MSLFYAWLYNRISKWTFICWYFKEGSSSTSPRVFEFFFFLRKCHICIHGFAFLKTATHFPWYLQNYARRWHFSAVKMIKAKQQKNIRACMYMFHTLETRLRRCPTSSGYDRNLFSPNLLDFWFLIEFISDAESKIFCSFEY